MRERLTELLEDCVGMVANAKRGGDTKGVAVWHLLGTVVSFVLEMDVC